MLDNFSGKTEREKNRVHKRMLKYMPLKEDDTSHTPDDESLKVNSLSRTSSGSLADAQGQSQSSSRDLPMFNSSTSLSSAPSSHSSHSSASSNMLLTPTSDDCRESPLVSRGSASSLSTRSSVPLSTAKRSLTLPSPSSPTSLESALIGLAKTAIAPSKLVLSPCHSSVLCVRRSI